MNWVFLPKLKGKANLPVGQNSAKNHVDNSGKQAILKEEISDGVPKLVESMFLL